MGRNSAIKHYDATPPGQPMELLSDRHGRIPVLHELLSSPWIMRASELARRDGACAAKRVGESVAVEWDSDAQRPVTFRRGDRIYRVDAVVQIWSAERAWWDPRTHVSRRFYRVVARGGVYDLAFDRASRTWMLIGVQD